jgi:hypothetical protein
VLTGGQQAEARWIIGAIPAVNAFKDSGVRYDVPGRQVGLTAAPSPFTLRERFPQT